MYKALNVIMNDEGVELCVLDFFLKSQCSHSFHISNTRRIQNHSVFYVFFVVIQKNTFILAMP